MDELEVWYLKVEKKMDIELDQREVVYQETLQEASLDNAIKGKN